MDPSELHHHLPRRQDLQCFPVAAPPPPPPPFPIAAGINVGALKQVPPVTQLRSPEVLKAPNAGGVLLGLPIDTRQGQEVALLPPPFAASMVQPDLGLHHWPRGADAFGCHIDQPPPTAAGRLPGSAGSAWTPAGESPPPSAALRLSGRGAYPELPTPSSSCFGGGGGGGDGCGQLQQPAGSYGKMLMPAAGPSSSSFSFSMQEMQALELLASATFGQALRQPSLGNVVAFYGEGVGCGAGHHLPFPPETPSTEELQIPSLSNGAREGKRACSDSRYKASTSTSSPPAAKKPRTAAPPLKVRKEKLGDRVAALQQLVAPFGKTDTASVLTEAVGYIKFLQEQVQTLSMPYLRSSTNSGMITTQGAAEDDDHQEESQQDLRSRGLCLVPLSYTSYFTGESASAWSSSPCFRGNLRYC